MRVELGGMSPFPTPCLPQAQSGGQISCAFSPMLIWATPSSHPRITCPTPSLNLKGLLRETEESNTLPLVSLPVQWTVTSCPFDGFCPLPGETELTWNDIQIFMNRFLLIQSFLVPLLQQIASALHFLALSYPPLYLQLLLVVEGEVVEAGVEVVEVVVPADFEHAAAGKLHDGVVNGHVIRDLVEMTLFVLQFLKGDPAEELGAVGLQMREELRRSAKEKLLFDLGCVLPIPTAHNPLVLVEPVVVGVDHPHAVLLVVGIEYLEHILANQFVVPIQIDHDRVLAAIVPHRVIDILQRGLSLGVVDVCILARADVIEVEVVADDLVSAVGGDVVEDDGEVVGVVLQEDGVEVVLDPEFGVVVEGRHHYAHGKLGREGGQAVLLLYARVLESLLCLLLFLQGAIYLHCEFAQAKAFRILVSFKEFDPSSIELYSLVSYFVGLVENFFNAELFHAYLFPSLLISCLSYETVPFGVSTMPEDCFLFSEILPRAPVLQP